MSTSWEEVTTSLKRFSASEDFGIVFGKGKHVCLSAIICLNDGSIAKNDGRLKVGDEIKSINGTSMIAHQPADVGEMINAIPLSENLIIVVQRLKYKGDDVEQHEVDHAAIATHNKADIVETQKENKGDDEEAKKVVEEGEGGEENGTSNKTTPGKFSYFPERNIEEEEKEMFPVHHTVRLMFNFSATKQDELSLVTGDIVTVTARGLDGWCYGRCQRTNDVGFFPGNFSLKVREKPDVVYEDIEQYNRKSDSDGVYEELPEESGSSTTHRNNGVEEVIYDEAAKRNVVSRTESHYELANGTIYAVVQKDKKKTANPPTTTVSDIEYGDMVTTRSSNSNESEAVYYSIVSDRSRNSYIPDTSSTDDYAYASLADIRRDGDVPPLPDRKYNAENLPTVDAAPIVAPFVHPMNTSEGLYESLDEDNMPPYQEKKEQRPQAPIPPPVANVPSMRAQSPKMDKKEDEEMTMDANVQKRDSDHNTQEPDEETKDKTKKKRGGLFGFFKKKKK
eukprot:m.24286 g.24286  ORF g.24286 m.24286 type:complete len:507 (+) comp5638_c0_seq1:128-1648(+)